MYKRIQQLFALWNWKHVEGLWWWQQSKPVVEFESEIVEGKPGEGKTRYLAWRAIKAMREGYVVASNFMVRDRLTGAQSIPIRNWIDVLRLTVEAVEQNIAIVFVIDELHLWADSRSFAKTPLWWRALMAQHRHYGIGILGSAQSLTRVELVLREIVSTLSRIRNRVFLRLPLFLIEKIDPSSVPVNENGLADYKLAGGSWLWSPWYVGYSTQQSVDLECWDTDEAIDAEILDLTKRLSAALVPETVLSYVDHAPHSAWSVPDSVFDECQKLCLAIGVEPPVFKNFNSDVWANSILAGNGDQSEPMSFVDYELVEGGSDV